MLCNVKIFVFTFSSILREFDLGLKLAENWARSVLKLMNWTKSKDTTGKVEPSKKFLEEEKLTFQRKISSVILDHDIPSDIMIYHDKPFLMWYLLLLCLLVVRCYILHLILIRLNQYLCKLIWTDDRNSDLCYCHWRCLEIPLSRSFFFFFWSIELESVRLSVKWLTLPNFLIIRCFM